jgi:sugar-specific transcriptional regulator TrmB
LNITAFLEKLRSLGFKENESKVLFVLLQGNPMNASKIAKEANIIRNSIYDILKDFVQRGYCNEIETNTILNYQCIDHQVLTDKIEKEFNETNRQKIKTLQETINNIKELYNNEKKPDKSESNDVNIELIRGYNKHRMEKYLEYLKQSRVTVLGMYKLRGVVSAELDKAACEFIKRGGELRSIYRVGLDFKIIKEGKAQPATEDDLVSVFEAFQRSGEQLRLCDMDIPNMTIFDGETVFNNISDKDIPKHKSADIIVKNKSNAKYMTDLFEYYWSRGLTMDEYKARKTNYPSS